MQHIRFDNYAYQWRIANTLNFTPLTHFLNGKYYPEAKVNNI